MKRLAFKMILKSGCESEFRERHEKMWPELQALLKKVGVRDYAIFLDKETNNLFATLKVRDAEGFERLQFLEIMQKWQVHLSDILATNPDRCPVSKSLEEVFYFA
ncbi:L-rhamnose mutarotase [Mucilaginibacter sp. SMC90]|uniref:L-rhamnose mutarotase n=1 Tax=Mucilaginibacter sp. SMC90 TaxID=2929803 RepID=UPI001FB4E68B|nr:L-rhamnose mutarotase [Mucilaginibacter sp. SMC90]UOE47748.1 L-rhamnose mutarotase [Mucilaginibacter sp. SMC90]